MMSSHNEIFPLKDYVKLKNNSNIMEYLGTKISALSLDDYIDSVHNNIINPFFKDSTTYNQKMKKYMNILTNYKTGVINGTFV
jgi:hypothetical protein